MFDLRPFLLDCEKILSSHELGKPGAYRRWKWSNSDKSRDLDLNPYGCADAANILYTIQSFPTNVDDQLSWVSVLRGLQDQESGLYEEPSHHPIHTTAHCLAALELFNAGPECRLKALEPYIQPDAMVAFLEGLNWEGQPWAASHRGAGLYAALTLAGMIDSSWSDRYFNWIYENTDPDTGLPRVGCVRPLSMRGTLSIFPHLAGGFHYLFNSEYARKPLRYPEALVDTCLEIFSTKAYPLGLSVGFAEIDWVYCLNRSVRQCGHRFLESRQALTLFTEAYIPFLQSLDPETDEGLNDLHSLFGTICCLAELQSALPGMLRTERPLRLVLDRRPFI